MLYIYQFWGSFGVGGGVVSASLSKLCQCSYRDDMPVLESLRGSNSCCIENLVVGISKQWLGTRVYQEAFEDYSKKGNFICCLYFVLILWDHFKLFLDAWWSWSQLPRSFSSCFYDSLLLTWIIPTFPPCWLRVLDQFMALVESS